MCTAGHAPSVRELENRIRGETWVHVLVLGGKSFHKRSLLSSRMEWNLKEENAEEETLQRGELLGSVKNTPNNYALVLCLQLVCKYYNLFNPQQCV